MVTIRTLELRDLDASFALMRMGGLNITANKEQWMRLKQWSLFSSPFKLANDPAGHVMEQTGRVVAFVGYSYRPFKYGGTVRTAAYFGDTVVHPQYRGVPGVRLIGAAFDYFRDRVVVATHNNAYIGKLWARLGAVAVAHSDITYVGTLSVQNRIVKKFGRNATCIRAIHALRLPLLIQRVAVACGTREFAAVRCAYDVNDQYRIHDGTREAVERLCEQYATAYDVGTYRSYEYLRWRYVQHPMSPYVVISVVAHQELIGLGVLGHDGDGNVQVCEFIYNPTMPSAAPAVLDAIIQVARARGGVTLQSKSVCADCRSVFERIGFDVVHKDHPSFFVRARDALREGCAGKALFTYGDFKER